MKHLDERSVDRLVQQALELDVKVDRSEALDLLEHLSWLLETNKQLNLTAITNHEDAVRLHVLDSLAAAPEVLSAPIGPLIDIGTGGGYPGYPLAVVTHRCATLLDSSGKKAKALSQFVQPRDDIEVTAARAEELAIERGAHYAVAVARAVAPLASLVELAQPLLMPGGNLICLKGSPDSSEIERGDAVAALLGLERIGMRGFQLPDHGEPRTIVSYRKVGNSTIELPRRAGRAQTRPLA